jgi:uncharacterized protein (TIGR02147 family)
MDYRAIVKAEFLKRRNENPFYSLRTFAKELGIAPSHLSYLIRGERGLSKDNALQVARALGLKTFAAQKFKFLVSAQSGRSKVERNIAKQGLKKKFIKEASI